MAREVRAPNGYVFASEQQQYLPTLIGDVHMLQKVDLEREGLTEYASIIKGSTNTTNTTTNIIHETHTEKLPDTSSNNYSLGYLANWNSSKDKTTPTTNEQTQYGWREPIQPIRDQSGTQTLGYLASWKASDKVNTASSYGNAWDQGNQMNQTGQNNQTVTQIASWSARDKVQNEHAKTSSSNNNTNSNIKETNRDENVKSSHSNWRSTNKTQTASGTSSRDRLSPNQNQQKIKVPISLDSNGIAEREFELDCCCCKGKKCCKHVIHIKASITFDRVYDF